MSKQRQTHFEFTARTGLLLAALASVIGSAAFHWIVQSSMTSHIAVAVAFTAIFVLAPIIFVGFIFPTSPAGMLVMKVHMKTWGYLVLVLSAFFLIGYDAWLINAWWLTQDVVEDAGYSIHQTVLSIIGFFILPGLLMSQVSTAEAIEVIRQAHLVKRYEMQTKAHIAILRNTLLRAQEKALIGFSNLTPAERDELANVMRGLVHGINDTINEIVDSVHTVSSIRIPYVPLNEQEQIRGYMDYVVGAISDDQHDAGPPTSGPGGGPRKHLHSPEIDGDGANKRRQEEPVTRDRGDRGGERRPDPRVPGGDRGDRRPTPEQRHEGRPAEQRGEQRGQQREQRSEQRGERRPQNSATTDDPGRGQRPTDRSGNDPRADRLGAARDSTPERPAQTIDITSVIEQMAATATDGADITSLFDWIDQQADRAA